MNKIVLAIETSQNSKTGFVSATYAPIQTCPSTCCFLNKGCYAQFGHTGIHLAKINKEVRNRKIKTIIDIAKEEAKEISLLSGTKPLRLHIVGDCKTSKAAEILSRAAKDYSEKNNQPVWTYTHAWREIPRNKWGDISVLASCETLEECKYAMKRGYAASIVRLKPFQGIMPFNNLNMVACKELVNSIKCEDCRLCFNDKKLIEKNRVICFFPHGSGKEKARNAILERQ